MVVVATATIKLHHNAQLKRCIVTSVTLQISLKILFQKNELKRTKLLIRKTLNKFMTNQVAMTVFRTSKEWKANVAVYINGQSVTFMTDSRASINLIDCIMIIHGRI